MHVNQSNSWRVQYRLGGMPNNTIINAYRDKRDSESFRMSEALEALCEYILFLEERNSLSKIYLVFIRQTLAGVFSTQDKANEYLNQLSKEDYDDSWIICEVVK